MSEIKWRLVSEEEVAAYYANRCGATRGPRSVVECEAPKHGPEVGHVGRGRTGRWFGWSDPEEKTSS